jgi:hypothetical protein
VIKRYSIPLIILFFSLVTGFSFSPVTRTLAASTESFTSQNAVASGAAVSDTLLGPTIGPDRTSSWFPASAQPPSTDRDFDGLTDDVEENGWENSAGSFITDPLDPDSDDDGLTDGQEKLFDTDPLDETSPGIYVEYINDLKTSKYFPWERHGNKFIALDSAVVRRGATLYVGGPADATIKVRKSRSFLSSLALRRDFCVGRWRITVPTSGTVGKYTVTLQKGSWSKSLNLYVIFELPTNMSEDDIEAFLYSDNPNNVRDEYSVFYITSADQEWPPKPAYHRSRGRGYVFQTDQYQAYVFEDYVIGAINGYTSRTGAAIALGHQVDKALRFESSSLRYNMWNALHSARHLAQCSTHANVLTGFARAAGIAARPVGADWDMGVVGSVLFDYSTEVWISGSSWKVMRAYKEDEPPDTRIDHGIRDPKPRSQWFYRESMADMIVAGKSNWNMGHMNTDWNQDADWDYNIGNYNKHRIVEWDWVDTLAKPYWGWSREPTDIGDPPQVPPWPSGVQSAEATSQPSIVQLGQVIADYGVDLDGNGRFDQLVVEIEVNATEPGYYSIGGLIDSDRFTSYAKIKAIASTASYTYLAAGTQTVSLVFDGRSISLARVDGPYEVRGLWISNLDLSSDPIDLAINTLDRKDPGYMTAAYRVDDFETLGATLMDRYSERGEDRDHDGLYESLTIDLELAILTPGTYKVMGELYDRQGRFLSQSTWTGSRSPASLQFDEIEGMPGPYTLRNLYLLNANDEIIDSRDLAYTTQQVIEAEGKTHIIDNSDLGGVESQAIMPDTYSDSAVDLNGDGLYDLLVINVRVEVDEPGRYRLEGWLEGEDGSLVSWTRSDATDLTVGSHSLSLTFSGPAIQSHNTDGPFTLMALKLLKGDVYEIVDEVDVAYTTSVYASNYAGTTNIFEDDMENGSRYWTADSPWRRTSSFFRSPSHSWGDSPDGDYSNNANVSLTTVSIDVPELTEPVLTFQGCYVLEANDYGYVEMSVNGGAWTTLLAHTDGTQHWYGERAKLDGTDVVTSLRARFRLASDAKGTAEGWYIDDVVITGDPDADDDGILTADEYYTGDTPLCTPNDPTSPPEMDTDGDGLLNCEDNDADGDGTPNYLDDDSDGDDISDRRESGCAAPGVACPGTPVDTDGDGVPDWLDEDSDANGVPDRGLDLYLPLIFKGGP